MLKRTNKSPFVKEVQNPSFFAAEKGEGEERNV